MAIQLVPGVALNVAMFFLTETPRFMAKEHDEVRAAETLSYLRNLPIDHPYVQDELAGIMNQVENERQLTAGAGRFAVIRETFGPGNRVRLIKCILLMIFFQFSGTNAINYVSLETIHPQIFGVRASRRCKLDALQLLNNMIWTAVSSFFALTDSDSLPIDSTRRRSLRLLASRAPASSSSPPESTVSFALLLPLSLCSSSPIVSVEFRCSLSAAASWLVSFSLPGCCSSRQISLTDLFFFF